jgi:hypothetical protein
MTCCTDVSRPQLNGGPPSILCKDYRLYLSTRIERLGSEADHSPPPSAGGRRAGAIHQILHRCLRGRTPVTACVSVKLIPLQCGPRQHSPRSRTRVLALPESAGMEAQCPASQKFSFESARWQQYLGISGPSVIYGLLHFSTGEIRLIQKCLLFPVYLCNVAFCAMIPPSRIKLS